MADLVSVWGTPVEYISTHVPQLYACSYTVGGTVFRLHCMHCAIASTRPLPVYMSSNPLPVWCFISVHRRLDIHSFRGTLSVCAPIPGPQILTHPVTWCVYVRSYMHAHGISMMLIHTHNIRMQHNYQHDIMLCMCNIVAWLPISVCILLEVYLRSIGCAYMYMRILQNMYNSAGIPLKCTPFVYDPASSLHREAYKCPYKENKLLFHLNTCTIHGIIVEEWGHLL